MPNAVEKMKDMLKQGGWEGASKTPDAPSGLNESEAGFVVMVKSETVCRAAAELMIVEENRLESVTKLLRAKYEHEMPLDRAQIAEREKQKQPVFVFTYDGKDKTFAADPKHWERYEDARKHVEESAKDFRREASELLDDFTQKNALKPETKEKIINAAGAQIEEEMRRKPAPEIIDPSTRPPVFQTLPLPGGKPPAKQKGQAVAAFV